MNKLTAVYCPVCEKILSPHVTRCLGCGHRVARPFLAGKRLLTASFVLFLITVSYGLWDYWERRHIEQAAKRLVQQEAEELEIHFHEKRRRTLMPLVQKARSTEEFQAFKAFADRMAAEGEVSLKKSVDAMLFCRQNEVDPNACIRVIRDNKWAFRPSAEAELHGSVGEELGTILLEHKGTTDWSKINWPTP